MMTDKHLFAGSYVYYLMFQIDQASLFNESLAVILYSSDWVEVIQMEILVVKTYKARLT